MQSTKILLAVGILSLASIFSSAAAQAQWGAVACGTWRDNNGTARVAIGSALNYATEALARERALQECRKNGQNCVAETFTRGCGFITVGNTTNAVRCTTGTTKDEALRKCRVGGYNCQDPIGGCVN